MGVNGEAFSGPLGRPNPPAPSTPRPENVACFGVIKRHGDEPDGGWAVKKHVHWCPSSFAMVDIGSLLPLVAAINANGSERFQPSACRSLVRIVATHATGI